MKIKCVGCGQVIDVPEERRGDILDCPSCAARMKVPSRRPALPELPPGGSAPRASEPMHDAPEGNADARVPCRMCGEPIRRGAKKCRFCGEYQSEGRPAHRSAGGVNGLAIASLVLGIIGLLTCCYGFIFQVLAIVLGQVAIGQIEQSRGQMEGLSMAHWGRGLGIAGLVLTVLVGALYVVAIVASGM